MRRPTVTTILLPRVGGNEWSQLPLRLIVGYGFMAHGIAKLVSGPERFADILLAIGVPEPHVLAWLTIIVELLGGLAVLLGVFVRLFSVPMAMILLVAMFTVHLPYGFSSIRLLAVTPAGAQFGPPGYETDLLYLACIVALAGGRPGPWSVDRLIASLRERRAAASHAGLIPLGQSPRPLHVNDRA
jgi:putative oxidoreductase